MIEGEIVHVAELQGGISAHVENVEINERQYVLKTHTEFDITGEKLFQRELNTIGLPSIKTYEHDELKPDQMLMEQINADTMTGKNFTEANLEALGNTLSQIHSRTFEHFSALNNQGQLEEASWSGFVDTLRERASRTRIDGVEMGEVAAKLATKIAEQKLPLFTLCHGDVHGNNVFCTDTGLLLFDNNADSIIATPHYDLATLFSEVMPGYRYGEVYSQGSNDRTNMAAFLEGYGKLPDDFEEYIDYYALLRLLTRYPNRFVKHQDDIIKLLLEK